LQAVFVKVFDGFSVADPYMPAVDFFDAHTVGAGPFDIRHGLTRLSERAILYLLS
jgi:hypothetical protein